MNFTIIRKSIIKNKAVNISLLFFIILSSFLMVSSSIIFIQLSGSIDSIFEKSKTPHFMQAHSGDIDRNAISDFAASTDEIKEWQIVEMVNLDGKCISFRKSMTNETVVLKDDMVDNGFVVQNEKFDYLLSLEDEVIFPKKGHLEVPLDYMNRYNLSVGDQVQIEDGKYCQEFVISGFIRDSQMAASMASSVRFLMNEEDYQILREQKEGCEYIIEFYLYDKTKARDIQNKYETDTRNLPQNGQAVTYNLLMLANSFADGISAIVIMLVSFILVVIAGLNLRFTILATLEEEIREIGVMKAIGLLNKDVKNIYLVIYRILAVSGCMLGYLIAWRMKDIFCGAIETTFGKYEVKAWEYVIPVLSAGIVYLLVLFFCRRTLKRVEKVSVVSALVRGEMQSQKSITRGNHDKMRVEKCNLKSVNLLLAFRELVLRFKTWGMLPIVFALAAAVIIIPINLLSTFHSPDFVTYMGSAACDLRIDLQEKDYMDRKSEIESELAVNQFVEKFNTFAVCNYEVYSEEGWEKIRVECGDFQDFEVAYLEGRQPEAENEIALSYLNAERFQANIGSAIRLRIKDMETEYTVCGIYQDITYGGYTSKMRYDYEENDVICYITYIGLADGADVNSMSENIKRLFPYTKVTPMDEFVGQTFGMIAQSLSKAVYVVMIVVLLVVMLITVLFLRLQMAKDRSENAMLRTVGFSSTDLTIQYMIKVFLTGAAGVVVGILIGNMLGERVISVIFRMLNMGLVEIVFLISPVKVFLMCPILILLVILMAGFLATADLKKCKLMQMLTE